MYYWLLKMWFQSDTINKLQKDDIQMNVWMDPLGDPLANRPIHMSWELSMELYLSCRFGLIDILNSQVTNCSVWGRTRTQSDSPEPLLTLIAIYIYSTVESIQQILHSIYEIGQYFGCMILAHFEPGSPLLLLSSIVGNWPHSITNTGQIIIHRKL
jgi:hypothetical protein